MLIRILLIADHAIVRSGLRLLIESHLGLKVVGEAGSRLDALTTANREQPDIILLDVTLPGTSGIDLLPELRASARKAHVLILTDSHDLEEHARAVHYGAMGVVLKAAAPEVLIKAIRKVHQGEIWLDRITIANVLSEKYRAPRQELPKKYSLVNLSLQVHLLGPFQVTVGGAPIEERRWQRPKSKLLFKLLALQAQHQLHRDQAIELLWPEQEPETAAGNLYRMIHAVRRALEPHPAPGTTSQFIITQGHQVILRAPGNLWTDVEDFERSAAKALKSDRTEDYEAALALYKDDLLVEDMYEDWVAVRREQLRLRHRDLLIRLAGLYQQRGQYEQSIRRYHEQVAREPSDEESHRQLMRLYALTGSRSKALLQYQLCCESMRKELDVDPEEATLQLHRRITGGELQTVASGERRRVPLFHQFTIRRGWVHSARLAPDGRTIFYSAAGEGGSLELFSADLESPESRPLGFDGAGLFAISPTGELALSLRRRFLRGYVSIGTLARSRPESGEVLEILDDVQWADWSPDSQSLAVVRDVEGRNRLEFPAGRALYETGGWISHPRVSPKGDWIAFIEHPIRADDGGSIGVVDMRGRKQTLSAGWVSAQGLAWHPTGTELWFTASKSGNTRAVYAVTLSGQERSIYRGLGSLTLHDMSRDGRVLVTRENTRLGIISLARGESQERDLSWFDWSLARDLSADGRSLLLTEAGEGGGATYGVYLRKTDGSPARRLGEGSALCLSPDGRWALAKLASSPAQLVLLPTETGEPKLIERAPLTYQPWACWFADGERILFAANEEGQGTRLYVQHISGGEPQTFTPRAEGVELSSPHSISPDSRIVAAVGPDKFIHLYPVGGGEPQRVRGAESGDVPVRWSKDGSALFVRKRGEVPAVVYQLDLTTGKKVRWRELSLPNGLGVDEILRVLLTPDGEGYAYTYTRGLSDLYLIDKLQ